MRGGRASPDSAGQLASKRALPGSFPSAPADIAATADKATPVSIWNHPYLNLGGFNSSGDTVLDHELTIYA